MQKNQKIISVRDILKEIFAHIAEKPDELLFFSLVNFAFLIIYEYAVGASSSVLFLPWICLYYAFWFAFFRYYYQRRPYVFTKKIFGTLVPSTKIIMLMVLLMSVIVFAPFIPLFLGYNQDYAVFVDKYVAKIQILGNHNMQYGSENLSFALLLYSILLIFTPNVIIRPMFAWISSLIGRSGSIRNAFSNSRGNYLQLLCLSVIFEVPMIIVEQVCTIFAINPVVMWIGLSPLLVLSNIMIAKLYDHFFLSLD